MPRCKYCGVEHEEGDLLRRQRDALVVVYCPVCHALLGQHRERTGDDAGWL